MLSRLADLAVRQPRRMALAALLAVIVAGVLGGPAAGMLKAKNPFSDPKSDSARAAATVERTTGAEASPGVIAVVAAPPASPAVASAARTIAAVRGVASVAAPGSGPAGGLVSRDGRSSIVAATLRVGPGEDADATVSRVQTALHGRTDVTLGGGDVAGVQTGKQATTDLGFAELLAFPLLALLAFFIFRGVAALLPLAVGMTAILGTFLVLRAVNAALPLSVFALNLVIGLGLGLAVDYSLFLVWRFREELGRGAEVPEALRTTMVTTGRTVLFSGLTVAAAMACLTVFPQRFLVSMGIGGAAVALVAAASALLVLPALLVLLGKRVGRAKVDPDATGGWYRLAEAVMRRPVLVAISTAVLLLALATPTPNVHWSGVDATVLPRAQSARVVADTLARDFPAAHGGAAMNVIASAPTPASASARSTLSAYAGRLAMVPGVALIRGPTRLGTGTWEIVLGSQSSAITAAAQRTVAAVRAVPAPVPVLVGGEAAAFADQRSAITAALPLALILLVAVTVLVLWLMTGSVVLPFKTLLMNALSAAAATGILVFVFQDGRLTGPLAYTSQGGIEETDFLILAALAFALATDYGVFLLARIKEARSQGLGEREAVAAGLQRTGRIVTSASILLAVAIGAFATSKIIFLKEVGVGTAAAVLIDAFVVRALLVPSLMALLGRWNWWSPGPLRALHRRIGLAEAA
ncbi:MAG: MMPL family transporter [Solirubrobacteraceae bacterium]